MSETPQQKAVKLVEWTRVAVRTLRYGPRETALALAGFVLLAATALLPEAHKDLPESLRRVWSAFPLVLSAAGVVLVAWAVVRIYRTVTAPLPEPGAAKPAAIKGAASFGPQDGELFARLGRDRELTRLRGLILDDRVPLIALMGESGVGKTSLVRSGLPHATRDDDLRVFYWEAMPSEPAAALLCALTDWTDDDAPATLDDLLQDDGRRRVVVLDQAEQLDPERHPDVFALLARAAAAPSSRTTWVVAFRREYSATWQDFVLDLPGADRQRVETLSLKRFPRDTAERVIAVLVEESGLTVEQKVVAEVVGNVAEDGKVSPVDIGISLLALSEVAPDAGTYSVDRFRSTGGQAGLLVRYLERLLKGFAEKERSEVLQALLELIHLDEERRVAEGRTIDELLEAVDPVQPERFRKRLDFLASSRARILERVPGTAEEELLRLTHERLIPALRRLTGTFLAEAEQARLEMERLYAIWSGDRRRKYLLSGRPLRRTLRHQAQFRWLERDVDKQDFILLSRRYRSFLRGAVGVGLVALGIGGVALASWVQVELHRKALESWNLPTDLYDYQEQLEELSLNRAVNQLGWLKPGILFLHLSGPGLTSLKGLPDSIITLDLIETGITSLEGLPEAITALDLSGTGITSLEGLTDSISTLDLSGTGIMNLEGLPEAITTLYLNQTEITNLEGLPDSITTLYLNQTEITNLEGLPGSITTLYFSHDPHRLMTRLRSLEGLPDSITTLYLNGTGIRRLEGLPDSIISLDLSETGITRLEGLPDSITTLGLSGTGIASLEALPDSITTLDLSRTGITSLEGLPASITTLDLSETEITSLEGLPDSIAALAFGRVGHRRGTGITSLEELPNSLTTLDLSESLITSLEGLPDSITTLDLSGTRITSLEGDLGRPRTRFRRPWISGLEGLPNSITTLDLSFSEITTLEGLPDSITTLDLSRTGITRLEGLPDSIATLDLSSSEITTLEGLPDSITTLDLSRTGITSLEGLPDSITTLDFSRTGITSLEGLPDSITTLDLSETGITSLEGLPSRLQELTLRAGQVESLNGLPPTVRSLHFVGLR